MTRMSLTLGVLVQALCIVKLKYLLLSVAILYSVTENYTAYLVVRILQGSRNSPIQSGNSRRQHPGSATVDGICIVL